MPANYITEVTVDLSNEVSNQLVATGLTTPGTIEAVKIKSLAGTTAQLRFGSNASPLVTVVEGEIRNDLGVKGLWITSPGATGGTITMEIHAWRVE